MARQCPRQLALVHALDALRVHANQSYHQENYRYLLWTELLVVNWLFVVAAVAVAAGVDELPTSAQFD
eukprot:5190481-Amphidinium_carterae.1